jgi:HD superfamily phosphohydrolase
VTELEIVRRIRGNVHGTVDVSALEDRILAHPYVQRLRRIRQLAFLSFVFPGATHSRFEHSLGVMQLAGITWSKMQANQKRLARTLERYDDLAKIEAQGAPLVHGLLGPTFAVMGDVFASPYVLQVLRLAALLHDVGHPPFSHSGERFMPTWDEVLTAAKGAPDYLKAHLARRRDAMVANGKDPARTPVRHEIYTLLLVERMLTEIARTRGEGEERLVPRDVLAVMSPDVGPEPGSPLLRHGLYKLCHELVSGEVDIDRMDYLLRDSRECGVVYGIFDATRIQDSLAIYHDPQDGGLHLAISYSGLAAFEDYLRARHSMYLQLYFHKTSVAAEAMMSHLAKLLGGWTLPADPLAYAELDEYNIEGALTDAARALRSRPEQRQFSALLRDLLRTRRLWKRVFEVTAHDDAGRATVRSSTAEASRIIEALGIPYETISSSSALTTFRERGEHEMSRNYLRLIKKDERQFPRVLPIEDHTELIAANSRVHIDRIYVPDDLDAQGRSLPGLVKQALRDRLGRQPGP